MVTLGIRLRELWQAKLLLAASLALASLAVLSSLASISLLPPGVSPRAATPAGAHTQILINDRRVSVLSAGFDSKTFGELHQGTVLAAGLMVRDPVRSLIADKARVPLPEIAFNDPQLPTDPTIPAEPTQTYAVTVAARPTVPILDVYAQAPSGPAARRLVDASAAGLAAYLARPGGFGLTAVQLGGGATVDAGRGPSVTTAIGSFLALFAASSLAGLLLIRTRRAWQRSDPRSKPVSA